MNKRMDPVKVNQYGENTNAITGYEKVNVRKSVSFITGIYYYNDFTQ
jgi:hypothetical protein